METRPKIIDKILHFKEFCFNVFDERLEKPFESAFFPCEEVANPLIRACLIDDYDLIRLLLSYGFVVWDPERIVSRRSSKDVTGMSSVRQIQ